MKFLFNFKSISNILITIILIFIVSNISYSQTTSKGKDFWFCFMPNYFEIYQNIYQVSISSENQTSGTVSMPGYKWSVTFNLGPNSGTIIDLPINFDATWHMSYYWYKILNEGVHVEADNDVRVYALNQSVLTSDASVVLPVSSLGNYYSLMAYTPVGLSEYCAVAVYDSTTVRLIPTRTIIANYPSNPAGVPIDYTLNKGQVVEISIEWDETGQNVYSIGSSKPFALFSGDLGAYIPANVYTCNFIYEQMFPVNTWGREYITAPLKTRKKGDTYRILASKDNTKISINDKFIDTILKAGSFYETKLSEASKISANYPISVAQFSNSSYYDSNDYSDPFMIMLNPVEQKITDATFDVFPFKYIDKDHNIDTAYYVNIIVKSSNIHNMYFDGADISQEFKPVPYDNNFSYAQLTITSGTHRIHSSDKCPFSAYVYAYSYEDAFGYSVGTDLPKIVKYDNLPPKDSLINSSCGSLTYTITDNFQGDIEKNSFDSYSQQYDTGIKSIELIEINNLTMEYLTSPTFRTDTTYFEFVISFHTLDFQNKGYAILKLTDNAGNSILDTFNYYPGNFATFTIKTNLSKSKIEPGDNVLLDVTISSNKWELYPVNNFNYSFVFKTNWMLYEGMIASPNLNNTWKVNIDSTKNIGDSTFLFICGSGTAPIVSNSIITRLKFLILYDNSIEYNPYIYSFETNVNTVNDSCGKYFIDNNEIKLNVCASDIMKIIITNTNYYLNINPNPTTNNELNLNYGIGLDSYIKIDLYNSLGNSVKQIYNPEIKSGTYSDKININDLSAGVYYIKIESGPYIETKKIMIIK